MSKVFSITLLIAATAYIRADSEEEAIAKARELPGQGLEVRDDGGDVEISGLQYDDEALPDVSFSPAMTIQPLGADDIEAIDCVHDDDEDETDAFVLRIEGVSDVTYDTAEEAKAAGEASGQEFEVVPRNEPEEADEGDTKGWEVGDRCDVPEAGDRGEILRFMSTPAENGFAIAVIKLDFGGANNAIVNVDKLDILYDEPDAARPY